MLPTPSNNGNNASSAMESNTNVAGELCLKNLRGVRWRVGLGILPSSPSASVEDFRRAVADSRRRYACLRHHLLLDPHLPKDGHEAGSLLLDNPLSQNPASMWAHFFKNAELEKMVEKDLARLYPEEGSIFQTPACQIMLRIVLVSWCLTHSEHGYKQGMHELLAPLLYVLQADVQHLLELHKNNEDHYIEELDGIPFHDYEFSRSMRWHDVDDDKNDLLVAIAHHKCLKDLEPEMRDMILLSNPYGPEGELGILMSQRFMEHDAYCMFDALMSGGNMVVAMADFFSPIPAIRSRTGLSPVMDASSAMYHLLSAVDPSLHSHLVALEVEPQYFGLRWLRVLYGREFSLENLLVIWDEIFSFPNTPADLPVQDRQPYFKILTSARGAFISALSVSMILYLRSSLLATQNATSCLQKLLSFPDNADLKKLIEKAKSFQVLAITTSFQLSSSHDEFSERNISLSIPSCVSPKTSLSLPPESYWEEKWSLLHKVEEPLRGNQTDPIFKVVRGFLKGKPSVSRTQSDSAPSKNANCKKGFLKSLRQKLLYDSSQVQKRVGHHVDKTSECEVFDPDTNVNVKKQSDVEGEDRGLPVGVYVQSITKQNLNALVEETSLSINDSVFSARSSLPSRSTDHDYERSSVGSNSVNCDNEEEAGSADVSFCDTRPVEQHGDLATNADFDNKVKDRKVLPGKFQWFWKSSKGNKGREENGGANDITDITNGKIIPNEIFRLYVPDASGVDGRVSDQKEIGTLRNLGRLMLQNIQVNPIFPTAFLQNYASSLTSIVSGINTQMLESALQQENCQAEEQETAVLEALKELRKISDFLLETS